MIIRTLWYSYQSFMGQLGVKEWDKKTNGRSLGKVRMSDHKDGITVDVELFPWFLVSCVMRASWLGLPPELFTVFFSQDSNVCPNLLLHKLPWSSWIWSTRWNSIHTYTNYIWQCCGRHDTALCIHNYLGLSKWPMTDDDPRLCGTECLGGEQEASLGSAREWKTNQAGFALPVSQLCRFCWSFVFCCLLHMTGMMNASKTWELRHELSNRVCAKFTVCLTVIFSCCLNTFDRQIQKWKALRLWGENWEVGRSQFPASLSSCSVASDLKSQQDQQSLRWVWINTYENTIFSGMNIHLPAILMWTTGVQGFDTLPGGILVQAWAPLGGSTGGISKRAQQLCGEIGKKYGKSWAQAWCLMGQGRWCPGVFPTGKSTMTGESIAFFAVFLGAIFSTFMYKSNNS